MSLLDHILSRSCFDLMIHRKRKSRVRVLIFGLIATVNHILNRNWFLAQLQLAFAIKAIRDPHSHEGYTQKITERLLKELSDEK